MINRLFNNPNISEWQSLCTRPTADNVTVKNAVTDILNQVRTNGDAALWQLARSIDKYEGESLLATEQEIATACNNVSEDLKRAIQQAKDNITKFHAAQVRTEAAIETMPGIQCWRKSVGIEKVGLYIPGGTAPLFSTILMLAVPAQLAGCKQIILCTPAKGNTPISPEILYTAQLCGITQIFKLGGAAAIGAMAFGTATVPKVYKIFGPGNQYVTEAKQQIQQYGVAIDMPAGPSEVCVIADGEANPAFVAADLLSQAEHGTDSQVMLIANKQFNIEALQSELSKQTAQLPRASMIEATLANSTIVVFDNEKDIIDFANEYAAEHLIINTVNADVIAEQIINAGSIFLGAYSPESVGDYASGTNHTLPTNGYAKQYSGVSVDSFVKKITYQKLTKEGLNNIADTVIRMAKAEQLDAHANAVVVRK